MAYERRSFAAHAVRTEIAGAIGASDQSFDIVATTGWPDGSAGKFYAVIDEGTSSEEKILVTTRSTSTLLGITRGADGTQTFSHSGGASIRVMFSGVDLDEANYWVSELASAASAANDLIIADGNDSLSQLAKGSNSTVLGVSSGGALGYSTVTSAQITDGTIVNGDVNASAAIAASKLEAIADQTLVGNLSGGSAAPSAVVVTRPFTTVRKSSDQTIPFSVGGFTVASGLTFTPDANVPHMVDGLIVYTGSTAERQLLSYAFSGGVGGLRSLTINESSALESVTTSPSTSDVDAGSSATLKRAILLRGWLVGNGTALTLGFWTGNIFGTDLGPITVYAGSYLRYRALT